MTATFTTLLDTATMQVVDHIVAEPSRSEAIALRSIPPTAELTLELDGAKNWLGMPADEILLAALARTIARTIGEGVCAVDVAVQSRWVLHAVPLICVTSEEAGPTEMLRGVHQALAAASHHSGAPSDIFFNYVGTEGNEATSSEPSRLGHALELRMYHSMGLLHLDWWYDTCRFDPYTIEELTEQFPLALFELTSDAEPI